GSKDYQLVTWSRDQTLRIWRVDPQLQKVRVQLGQRDASCLFPSTSTLTVLLSCSCAPARASRTCWTPLVLGLAQVSDVPGSPKAITEAVRQLILCRVRPPSPCPARLSSVSAPPLSSDLDSGARQDSVLGSGLPQTLQQEFSLVNLQIRNVNVEVE
ncbi:unnamed protein product, partial [Tetraodon nigroviridis]